MIYVSTTLVLAWALGKVFGEMETATYIVDCIGAVLSGGIFGDHCSPISNTTILSSTGADADHIDHIKTQIPYAILNAFIAIIGFVVAGIIASAFTLILTKVLLVVAILLLSKCQNKKFILR